MALLVAQLRWELGKLLARKRTQLGFVACVLFQLLVLWMLQHGAARESVERAMLRGGFTFEENFTGPTVGQFIMGQTMNLLGALYIALVAGEIVSREIEDGTIRMLLCRPVSRLRIVLLKLATALLYTCAITAFIGTSSLAIGLLFEGAGHWLIFPIKEGPVARFDFLPGLARYAGAIALNSLSVCTIACLAFALSCFNLKPAVAAVAALSVCIIDDTLRNIPYLAEARPYFLMTRIVTWLRVYEMEIPGGYMVRNYAALFVLNTFLVTLGYLSFRSRDFK